MELCAWDHALCLDIEIIALKSDESHFLHVGECESMDEFKKCLNEFLVWFKREVAKKA